MPRFERRTALSHPLADVTAWHRRPGAFTRLTPPGWAVVLDGPTNGVAPGSRVTVRATIPEFPGLGGMLPGIGGRLREHPPGFTWVLEHEALDASGRDGDNDDGFVDRQVSGPFARYRHEHRFAAEGPASAVVNDRITWQLPAPLAIANRVVTRRFAELFSFRARQLEADLALHARLAAAPNARPLRIGITGASGTVGTQLAALATTGGHEVVRFTRGSTSAHPNDAHWDPVAGRIDVDALASLDAIVHLAGASIGGRFTEARKDEIRRSRIEGTSTLASALSLLGADAPALIQASAIGLYGARRPGELLSEDTEPGDGFLAEVVREWEQAARPAIEAGVRTVFIRTGIVLTTAPGALLPQLPLFRVGLGGRLTRGDRAVSWITLDDLVRLYLTAAATPSMSGPYNAVAPEPVTAAQFADAMGRVLDRPALVPVPPFGPQAVLGREGADQLIETDQRVSAARALEAGFDFAQPHLAGALRHVLVRGRS